MGWEVLDGSPRMNGGEVSEEPWGDPSLFGVGRDPFQELNDRKSQNMPPASGAAGPRTSSRKIRRHPDGRDDVRIHASCCGGMVVLACCRDHLVNRPCPVARTLQ
eukprot:978434-Rhodomonas_salina.1